MMKPGTGDAPVIAPGTPQYSVMMRGEGWAKSNQVNKPIKEGMTIDDVLNEVKAKQKFRDMEIQIKRKVPDSGQVVTMPIQYRSKNQRVPAEHNYAIHANDQILIKQVIYSPMDKFVDTLIPYAKN